MLAEKRALSREAYKEDSDTQDIVERRFVKMTEATLDIGAVLVRHEQGSPAKSNPATMRALGEIGVLSEETSTAMAQAARFRNVLAHTYGDVINQDVVYDALQDLKRYRQFAREIRVYLDSTDAFED